MNYQIPKERIHLGGAAERAIRASCTSKKAEYRWLKLDLCVSRKAPPVGVELPRVTSSASANTAIRRLLDVGDLIQEVLGVLCLNSAGQVVAMAIPFSGGVASTTVDIAVLLKPVLLVPTCSSFILFHNHPSGNLTPSGDDIRITAALKRVTDVVGVKFLDHLILTNEGYQSMDEAGVFPK